LLILSLTSYRLVHCVSNMRYFFLAVIAFITILLLWINIRLYSENYTIEEKKSDIILQLNFIEKELKEQNLGLRTQQTLPEGFVFINVLYGLSWCELSLASKNDSTLRSKALAESLFAYNEINSGNGKRSFNSNLTPPYGIFYSGWKNYLLSKILMLDTVFQGSKSCIDNFKSSCDSIMNALTQSKSPYLESYPSQSWPADMFPAMASLSNHDKIFNPEYTHQLRVWSNLARSHTDPATGMIPHEADSKTGQSRDEARGSSMSLMVRLLTEINPSLALEQYALFKKYFVSTSIGLPSVREYRKGHVKSEDIDSGPVVFGIGFSATISAIGTFAVMNDNWLSEKQYKTVNAFGFDFKTRNQKKYLFGTFPIADAFIAWGRTSGLKSISESNFGTWRILFNSTSLLLLTLLWLVYFRKSKSSL
jgi:hypothetical protein